MASSRTYTHGCVGWGYRCGIHGGTSRGATVEAVLAKLADDAEDWKILGAGEIAVATPPKNSADRAAKHGPLLIQVGGLVAKRKAA